MQIKYDPQVDALTLILKEDSVVESEYLEDLEIVIDYNEKDEVVAFEIFEWSKREKSKEGIKIPLDFQVKTLPTTYPHE